MPDTVLDIQNLIVHFSQRTAWGRVRNVVQAVRGVDLAVGKGEIVGLVGESGCGKSTLAKAVVKLVAPTAGRIAVNGVDWTALSERRLRPLRPQVQMVFQDPYGSLNPRLRIGAALAEPLAIHRVGSPADRRAQVVSMLERVGLHPDDAQKYPHEFSGGQRQRIGIARALMLGPSLLLADEAVSALDVSVQAQILNLLLDLQSDHGHSLLFISHDLRVVERIADRAAVMYLGKIVELAPAENLFRMPRHPYTRALASAVPVLDPQQRRKRILLEGEPPSPTNPPSGCGFRLRCPFASERCANEEPMLQGDTHRFACHHPLPQ